MSGSATSFVLSNGQSNGGSASFTYANLESAEMGFSSVTLQSKRRIEHSDDESSISMLSTSSASHHASFHKQTLYSNFMSAKQTRSSSSLPPKKRRIFFHEDIDGNIGVAVNDGNSGASAARSVLSETNCSLQAGSTEVEQASRKNDTMTNRSNRRKRRKTHSHKTSAVKDMDGFEMGMGYFSMVSPLSNSSVVTADTELAATLLSLKESTPSNNTSTATDKGHTPATTLLSCSFTATSVDTTLPEKSSSNHSSCASYEMYERTVEKSDHVLSQFKDAKHTLLQAYLGALKQQFLQ